MRRSRQRSSLSYEAANAAKCEDSAATDSAERGGVEPPRACALPVFKTGAVDHSATSPAWLPRQLRHIVTCRGSQGLRHAIDGGGSWACGGAEQQSGRVGGPGLVFRG